jgi:hypothetical protein
MISRGPEESGKQVLMVVVVSVLVMMILSFSPKKKGVYLWKVIAAETLVFLTSSHLISSHHLILFLPEPRV